MQLDNSIYIGYDLGGPYPVPDLDELEERPPEGATCRDCHQFRYLTGKSGLGKCTMLEWTPTKSPVQPACSEYFPDVGDFEF